MKTDLRVFAETEFRMIMYAFLFGIASAALYDVFRIARTFFGCGLKAHERYSSVDLPLIGKARKGQKSKLGKNVSGAVLIAADLLYMLIFAVFTVIFYYSYADGIVRWYTLTGLGIGFFVYMKTVGQVTKNAVGAILFMLSTACRYIWFFGIKPFILLKKIFSVTVGRAYGAYLMRRSEALTEKYINTVLKKKLNDIGSKISESTEV